MSLDLVVESFCYGNIEDIDLKDKLNITFYTSITEHLKKNSSDRPIETFWCLVKNLKSASIIKKHGGPPLDRFTHNLLDIMTWNMERFPLKGDTTMKAVAELIQDLNVDIIGVQEIIKIGAFSEMMSWLPNYNFVFQESYFHQ